MVDPLYELLIPYFDAQDAHLTRPAPTDPVTIQYLARLTTLPVQALTSSEPLSLSQSSQSILRSLQALSKRSHRPIISSDDHLSHLRTVLPNIATLSRRPGLIQLRCNAAQPADGAHGACQLNALGLKRGD